MKHPARSLPPQPSKSFLRYPRMSDRHLKSTYDPAIPVSSLDQCPFLLRRNRSYVLGNEDGDCRSQRLSQFSLQGN